MNMMYIMYKESMHDYEVKSLPALKSYTSLLAGGTNQTDHYYQSYPVWRERGREKERDREREEREREREGGRKGKG